MDTSVFRLEGVTKRYGDLVALNDASLSVGANEYLSFLGPSGSGKTTLLRVIAGFEAPEKGRIFFEGRDITNVQAHARRIGFVFQNFALFPHLTVMQNVGFGLANGKSGIAAAEVERRAAEMIDLVGLSGMEGRGVDQISGGQRQRVALARTLAMKPKLVLLDEPLGALDANLRSRMRNELRAIRERLGVTFLHVTGSETEALAMGDRVVVLDRGTIIQTGAPGEIYDRPASPDVANFLNRFNLFEGTLANGSFTSSFGTVKVHVATRANRDVYAVRYDRVKALPLTARSGDAPALKATFIASEYLGSSIMNFFDAGHGHLVEMEHHLSLGAPEVYEPKQEYLLTWNPEQAIVFGREAAK